ncbi:hypothetical protein EG68_10515 [Paragonimus skrjabini miyazakii]|uniref:Ig-like domain-containing protein n=1 Tax=Paragonimus skrjabini miyazakii TaxID=59628 RepID=A0A8S9YF74_9TREM|nr:hypothetical protein EG68_10515 [Paragonimus skrjabini miyazakii]
MAIPKYTFLRCPYDITSRSSKPMREYLYRSLFKDNHEQYAIRRHTEHGFEITVPELCFHQFNERSDRRTLGTNDKVINSFERWRLDARKLLLQTEQQFRRSKIRFSESVNEERVGDNVIPQERIEISEHQQVVVGTHSNGPTNHILKIRPEIETPDFTRFRFPSEVDKSDRLSKSNKHEMLDNTQQTKNHSETSESSTVSGLSPDITRRPRQSENFMSENFRTKKLQKMNEYDIMVSPLFSHQSRQTTRAQSERKLDETLENDPIGIETKVRDRTVHFPLYRERLRHRPLKNHQSMASMISHRYKDDSSLDLKTPREIISEAVRTSFNRMLLENNSWLERIRVNRQFDDIQWIFDPRIHQYTRKRDDHIHFDKIRRTEVPTDREDIEIYKREILKQGTPWWTPIVRWTEGSWSYVPTTETSKGFVRSLDREVGRDKVVDKTHTSTWTSHLSELRTFVQDRMLSEQKPLTFAKSEDTRFSHQATIDPSFVILPASTTASCQVVLSRTNITQQISLEWYRYSARTERPELLLSISLGEQKAHTVSPRFLEPVRIYAYPPLKWTDIYTVNINPLRILDYGYYACRNRYMSGTSDSSTIEITKVSPRPLCIMQRGSRPQVRLMKLVGSRLREVTTYSNMWSEVDSVKSSKLPDEKSRNNIHVSECLEAGMELIVYCVVIPFQLLCERADDIAGGLRLMDTRTQAYLHVPTEATVNQSRTLELPDLTHEVPLPDTLSSVDWTVQFRAWRITLHSKHTDASVFCKAQPELRPASFANPDYWQWLKVQLTPERRHQLSRRSLPLKLCVSSGPGTLIIHPRPISRDDKFLLALVQIQPHQELTCSLSDTALGRLNLTMYPIAHGKVLQAEIEGLSNPPSWRDPNSLPNPWPQTYYPNRIGVLIPSNWSVLGYYFVHCSVVGTNITSTFILNVQPPQWTLRQLAVDVRMAWMVIMLPVLVLIYTNLRRCMHERRERQERHLLALFRDIEAEISLDDV